MTTFKHSGDLGDIIYSLPTIRALGGGVLYLDINGGRGDSVISKLTFAGHTKFNLKAYETIRPLLLEQSYLDDVRVWQGESVVWNLDLFRRHIGDLSAPLAALHLRQFNLDETLQNDPWLTIQSPVIALTKSIIVNRTPRYQSKYHWWVLNQGKFIERATFIGLQKEHELFEYTFGCQIDFHETKDALEIAQVLSGADTFLGNQSFVMSIAIGLGVPFYQEVYDPVPNCIVTRDNAKYF